MRLVRNALGLHGRKMNRVCRVIWLKLSQGSEDMESPALKQFRKKMANPVHWRLVHKTLHKFSREDLQNIQGANKVIAQLAESLHITLSNAERQEAAQWLSAQDFDPQSKRDTLRVWKFVKGK